MSYSTTDFRNQYSGNGSTTAFSFPYLFHDEDHLVVTLTDSAGTDTVQTKTTHYTVAGVGVSAGGTVTMLTAPATGETLTLERIVPSTQESDYVADDSLDAENLEKDIDLAKMAVQQLAATGGDVDRSIKFPNTEASYSTTLPVVASRASKTLGFDSSGALTVVTPVTTVEDSLVHNGTASGTDTYSITFSPAPTAYSATDIYFATFTNANTGASTINVNSLGAKDIVKRGGAALEAGDISASQRSLLIYNGTNFELVGLYEHKGTHVTGGSDEVDGDKLDIDWTPSNYTPTTSPSEADNADNLTAHLAGIDAELAGSGKVNQVVTAESTTYSSTTTAVPFDDTIPQNTEGAEILTASITPSSASSILVISVSTNIGADAGRNVAAALFKDSTADAIGANWVAADTSKLYNLAYSIKVTSGGTSSQTYKLRIGPNAGTAYINGNNSSRIGGGAIKTTLTITEILP